MCAARMRRGAAACSSRLDSLQLQGGGEQGGPQTGDPRGSRPGRPRELVPGSKQPRESVVSWWTTPVSGRATGGLHLSTGSKVALVLRPFHEAHHALGICGYSGAGVKLA